jgi:hypothetical protein
LQKACFDGCTHPTCLWIYKKLSKAKKVTRKELEANDFMHALATPALGRYVGHGRKGNLLILTRKVTELHGIPRCLVIDNVTPESTKVLEDSIEFQIKFLKGMLTFNRAQDILRQKSKGSIEQYLENKHQRKGPRVNKKPSTQGRQSECRMQEPSEEDFTLVVSLNEYILRGDAVGTSCTYVDSRV